MAERSRAAEDKGGRSKAPRVPGTTKLLRLAAVREDVRAMSRRAFNKIKEGLVEALAIARGERRPLDCLDENCRAAGSCLRPLGICRSSSGEVAKRVDARRQP